MPTYVCIYSCVDVHSHMYMHAHARDFSTTRIQQCLHVCVCVCVLCVCVFMCVCVFVRTCCMHVHMLSECMYVNQQPDKQVCMESASMNWKTRVIQLTRSEQVIAPIRARHHPTPVTTTSSA